MNECFGIHMDLRKLMQSAKGTEEMNPSGLGF